MLRDDGEGLSFLLFFDVMWKSLSLSRFAGSPVIS